MDNLDTVTLQEPAECQKKVIFPPFSLSSFDRTRTRHVQAIILLFMLPRLFSPMLGNCGRQMMFSRGLRI